MEEHLFLVQSNILNDEDFCDFSSMGLHSAIGSDSCDHVGTHIYILVEFSFPFSFK